ncbi:hypothetical protein M8J75_012609 [Diaphorina citri]|nr:hypothetical protein M8J75_012609 [Diaphorina citri]
MITEKVNHCLKQEFQRSENITDTHNMIYCAALTVCFLMNISISDGSSATTRVKSEPPWKFRIEGKINKLRKSIGILTQYFRDPNHASANIKTKVKQLSYFARLKHWKKRLYSEVEIKSVEVINDNENLRHVIDDTNKKITKFMYRAGLNNPCNSDKQLHAFLETADDIQNQYSRRAIQLETEIDVLKQQKKMAKDILKEIKF